MKRFMPIASLAPLLIGGVLALYAPAVDAAQGDSAARTGKQRQRTPNTLVCVFDYRGGEGTADPVLPVGGIHRGKWLAGRYWRGKLPRRAKLTVYSLTQGPVGSLRVTGIAPWQGMLELNLFDGFKGEWRLHAKGDLSRIMGVGMDASVQPHDFVAALWRRDGSEVRWSKATLLDRGQPSYRKIARDYVGSRWMRDYLASHGLPESVLDHTQIVQMLSVDLDGDKRDEVLMSVYWESPDLETVELEARNYLLMVKTLATGERKVVALANHDQCILRHQEQVIGCADIDNDGRAEVITVYDDDTPTEAFHIYRSDENREVAGYKIIYGE